ncbi:MAG: MATE family efflux transporter [Eubacterium sp.]|nr:MATE family efflux transporter [Eubacterium sp.]
MSHHVFGFISIRGAVALARQMHMLASYWGFEQMAVSGVSLIDSVFQLLIYIFAAFGTGGAVVAGQYLGAGKQEEARDTSGQLVWFSGLISLGIMGIIYLLRKLLLTVVFGAVTPEVYACANSYLLIVVLSIPALSVYESGAAIFRTMGNSQITMYLSAMMNVINICGNAFFIYFLKFGTAGAAAATVIARYAAAVVMVCLLLQKKRVLHLEKTLHYHLDGKQIRKILSIGVPNGIENGLFQAGKIILASLVAGFGTSAITANAVCQTVASIQVIPGTAMQLAATTVVARCIGAKDEQQARYYNRVLLLLSYTALFVFCGLMWLALPVILNWYHLSRATAELTSQMVLVHTIGAALIWPLTFVLPASMRAAGDVRFAMVISIISMWVSRIGASYLFAKVLGTGALGVWLAMVCDWLFRAVVFSVRWLGGKWKEYRMI